MAKDPEPPPPHPDRGWTLALGQWKEEAEGILKRKLSSCWGDREQRTNVD